MLTSFLIITVPLINLLFLRVLCPSEPWKSSSCRSAQIIGAEHEKEFKFGLYSFSNTMQDVFNNPS